MVSRADVEEAKERFAGRVRRTPVMDVSTPERLLWLKLEQLQLSGSFKIRGAFNKILSTPDLTNGIVTASGGNAGLAHALAAKGSGVKATVFVPTTAPASKVKRLREYGAEVHLVGSAYSEAAEAALAHRDKTGAVLTHAYDQPEIVAGAGTIALEILEDIPDLDTLLVAVGGGGLIGGIAAALEGSRVKVVAVEPTECPTLHAALAAGRPVDVSVSGCARDSLGAKRIGEIAFEVAQRTKIESILVEDGAILEARRQLWEDFRIAAETGAATAYAPLLNGVYKAAPGEKVCVLVCGSNTGARVVIVELTRADPTTL